jgi:hypothetical protein
VVPLILSLAIVSSSMLGWMNSSTVKRPWSGLWRMLTNAEMILMMRIIVAVVYWSLLALVGLRRLL